MGISRKENGSLVKKAGRTLVDLALSLTSHNAIANSAVTQEVNQINTSLTSSVTNINNNKEYKPSSRVINAQTDLLRVILGDNNHVINQPYYFSTDYGALTNMPPGAPTTSAFYGWREVKCVMSLTTVILHEMYPNYGRTHLNTYDTNVNTWYGWRTIGGNMRPNFSNLLASLTTDGTVTATQDSFLVGTINQYGELFINNVNIGRTGDKPVNFYLPLKTGDIVRISNYAQQTSEARIRIYGVLS